MKISVYNRFDSHPDRDTQTGGGKTKQKTVSRFIDKTVVLMRVTPHTHTNRFADYIRGWVVSETLRFSPCVTTVDKIKVCTD